MEIEFNNWTHGVVKTSVQRKGLTMAKRRKFASDFKAQVVLEVLSGVKTTAQVCQEHRLKVSLLSHRKREFIERAPELFAGNAGNGQSEAKVAKLERMVGRLTMELEVAHLSPSLAQCRPGPVHPGLSGHCIGIDWTRWRTVPGGKASLYLNSPSPASVR